MHRKGNFVGRKAFGRNDVGKLCSIFKGMLNLELIKVSFDVCEIYSVGRERIFTHVVYKITRDVIITHNYSFFNKILNV